MKQKIIELLLKDPIAKVSSIMEDIKKETLCSLEERNKKLLICQNCNKLKMNFCSECHCYMPAKAFIKHNSCPLNLHNI